MIRINALGYKALTALRSLNRDHTRLIGDVVVGRDKQVLEDHADDILRWCAEAGITCYEREQAPDHTYSHEIAIGWRWIIQSSSQVIVFHDSLLPKLRGFNPLVTALINGHHETGVTCLFAEEGYDSGKIIDQEKLRIQYPKKIEEAIQEIAPLYGKILNRVMEAMNSGKLHSIAQNESDASYSIWRDEEDYYIPWQWSADKIKRMIDAVGYPYLGARTRCGNEDYIVEEAEALPDIVIENRTPGKVIFRQENSLTIICGVGLLKILSMRKADGKPFDINSKFRMRFY